MSHADVVALLESSVLTPGRLRALVAAETDEQGITGASPAVAPVESPGYPLTAGAPAPWEPAGAAAGATAVQIAGFSMKRTVTVMMSGVGTPLSSVGV